MAPYRTAIIACGTIARVHARGWLGVPERPVALGALADTHPDARREFGDFFGVPGDKRYADYREMLDRERPELVDVCSWHGQHAENMLVACERNDVKLVISYQRPHHATWLKARDLIQEGTIGKIIQISMSD